MTFATNFMEDDINDFLQRKNLRLINPKRKNGLILIKTYYAEFAGPGAIIGGCFDQDLETVIPVGKLSLIEPSNPQERQRAYLIRRQWVRLIKQITDNPVPHERAQVILNQFEHWFDAETARKVPDEIFALIVGVLPCTITKARDLVNRL
ncbi:hypothetical protein [Geminocystis sp. NIES-3709]|uniref:hypothetical protein n=1 Tax=Geminocystis sp. NIES-3709 TaxID=1617448 RepID=UPI0005FC9837|nr:hypothetical protein [Geminocystis sp. NIES-3709]BAQ66000.1 hypothetical protein GM3709_2765 [Geminocystis sp. NIES-3709]